MHSLTADTFIVHLTFPGPNLSRKHLNLNIDKPRNRYMKKSAAPLADRISDAIEMLTRLLIELERGRSASANGKLLPFDRSIRESTEAGKDAIPFLGGGSDEPA